LLELGAELELRDLGKERMSKTELDRLMASRDYKEFLNPRNELYRARKMKENPPSRLEAVELMVKEPNLIRRPIAIRGARIVLGYEEEAYKKLMK
jgi:arsenate reductase-like glutaredoxin family protein